jgi:hypothetical protein
MSYGNLKVKQAIDKFWLENHYPPTIRDLKAMTGYASTSTIVYHVSRLSGTRITNGRIIPLWVDDVFASVRVKAV